MRQRGCMEPSGISACSSSSLLSGINTFISKNGVFLNTSFLMVHCCDSSNKGGVNINFYHRPSITGRSSTRPPCSSVPFTCTRRVHCLHILSCYHKFNYPYCYCYHHHIYYILLLLLSLHVVVTELISFRARLVQLALHEQPLLLELHLAEQARARIVDVHDPPVVHIQLAHDQVMHRRRHLLHHRASKLIPPM